MELTEKFKESKVKKVKGKEKPTMTNRILPKRDFEKVMEHDKIYLGILNEILEFAVIKQDVLGKEAHTILKDQTREKIIDGIDILLEWSKVKLYCLDTKAKIVIQQKLLDDKENHFEQVFLPQWEIEKKETIENFDLTIEKARKLVSDKPKMSQEIVSKLILELYWFDALEKKQKKEIEYMWQLYKPLKRLVGAYDKLTEKRTSVDGK